MYTWNQIQYCHGKGGIQQKETFFTSKLDLNLKQKLVEGQSGSKFCMVLKLGCWKIDQMWESKLKTLKINTQLYYNIWGFHLTYPCTYPVSFEMWCWRKMEIKWTNHVKNAEALQGVKEESNILCTIQRRTSTWIGLILWRNCLLKHITEGKIEEGRTEVTERWGRRHKQLLDELKEMRGYWKLNEKALYCTLWRTRFRKD